MRSVNKSGAWRGEGWGSEKRQKRKDGHIEELPIEGGGSNLLHTMKKYSVEFFSSVA